MEAFTILADRYYKTITNASARLSATEARARHWKGTRYASLNARQRQFILFIISNLLAQASRLCLIWRWKAQARRLRYGLNMDYQIVK